MQFVTLIRKASHYISSIGIPILSTRHTQYSRNEYQKIISSLKNVCSLLSHLNISMCQNAHIFYVLENQVTSPEKFYKSYNCDRKHHVVKSSEI